MNALDSPLEALAFNYLSYGGLTFINNMWTWVAVLTATVSFFWRIKASTSVSPKSDPVLSCSPDSTSPPKMVSPSSRPERLVVEPPSTATHDSLTTSRAPLVRAVENTDGVTRGKFMVYYYEEGENVCKGEECEGEYDDGDFNGQAELRCWGDMGWYRHQDLKVLDGNVVRLWDSYGCSRQRNSTSGSGCLMLY